MPTTTDRFPADYDWRARFPRAELALRRPGGRLYIAEDPDGGRMWTIYDSSSPDHLDVDLSGTMVAVTEYTGQGRKRDLVVAIV